MMLRLLVHSLNNLHLKNVGLPISQAAGRTLTARDVDAKPVADPFLQHVRTTFILRRKNKVPLVKARQNPSRRRLKNRHFIYELVEDTNIKKKEPVKVILTTSIDGLGSKGQTVEVSRHKARNELLLPGLAVYASPENLKKYSNFVQELKEDQPSSEYSRQTARSLSLRVISVSMNMSNPWQIEPWHIRVAFRKAGIIVPEEALTLPSQPITGPDLSLENKEFLVRVKINNKEEAPVRCRIHHYATDVRERLPWVREFWKHPVEPIFPEEASVLNDLFINYKARFSANK